MNTLTWAATERNREWMATLPENPPVVEFSKRHMKEMNKLLDKMRGDRYHRFTRRTTRVLLVAAILALTTITVFAVPQTRAYILNEIQELSIFESQFQSDEKFDGTINCGYIHEGFEVIKEEYTEYHSIIDFENQNEMRFSIIKVPNGDEMGFDNEDTNKTIMITDDKEIIIFEKENGIIKIVWCDEDITYTITGNITLEEIILIAENIK